MSQYPRRTPYGLLRKTKQSRKPAEPRNENGHIVGSQTSQAQRKRRRSGMSMKECGYDDPEDNVKDFDFTQMFHKGSTIHYTWGKIESDGIVAPRRKRRRTVPRMRADPRCVAGYTIFDDWESTPKPLDSNSPERSGLLRISLEIREMIYGYLLLHSQPILLDQEWSRVENQHGGNHSIMKVCKQICIESSAFFYKNNHFISLIRPGPPRKAWDVYINSAKYLPMIRNAVIKCDRQSDSGKWLLQTASCLKALVKAGTRPESLTLVLEPRRAYALASRGVEGNMGENVIKFSDFLSVRQAIMKVVRRVKCQTFNVAIKKPGGKKLLIAIDMTDLKFMEAEGDSIPYEEARQRAKWRVNEVRKQLLGLRDRFEAVFNDDETAVKEGKCRVLQESEAIMYGMGLAKELQSEEERSFHYHD